MIGTKLPADSMNTGASVSPVGTAISLRILHGL